MRRVSGQWPAWRKNKGSKKAMRKKEERVLVSFFAAAQAMAAEKACRRAELPGRLIPTPRQISAGCGLVWSAPPQWEERIRKRLEEEKIQYEKILRMMV